MNDHCGCSTVQPSDGLSVPTKEPLTNQQPEPYQLPSSDIVMRAPANMPAAPQPFEPAGLGPSTQSGDVNLQSTINPLASSDVGGTAGHDAAVCVSARGESDGAGVFDARDARLLSPTTQCPLARQVVAPHCSGPETIPDEPRASYPAQLLRLRSSCRERYRNVYNVLDSEIQIRVGIIRIKLVH